MVCAVCFYLTPILNPDLYNPINKDGNELAKSLSNYLNRSFYGQNIDFKIYLVPEWTKLHTRIFMLKNLFLGLSLGFWSVLIVMAAEGFDEKFKATASNFVPNFARFTFVLFAWIPLFIPAETDYKNLLYITWSLFFVMAASSFWSIINLEDTFYEINSIKNKQGNV